MIEKIDHKKLQLENAELKKRERKIEAIEEEYKELLELFYQVYDYAGELFYYAQKLEKAVEDKEFNDLIVPPKGAREISEKTQKFMKGRKR